MRKTNVCLNVFCLILFLFASAGFAAAQHEGHDTSGTAPTAEGSLPRSKGDETPCQRVARLTAELDQDFDGLLGLPDPGELQKRLAESKFPWVIANAFTTGDQFRPALLAFVNVSSDAR